MKTVIQERDIEEVPSTRRNPIISEIFHRLDFVERRGSGLKKIRNETANLYGYTNDFTPAFKSTRTAFHVILKNMNYDLVGNLESTHQDTHQVTMQDKRTESILKFCSVPRTRDELQIFTGLVDRGHFKEKL